MRRSQWRYYGRRITNSYLNGVIFRIIIHSFIERSERTFVKKIWVIGTWLLYMVSIISLTSFLNAFLYILFSSWFIVASRTITSMIASFLVLKFIVRFLPERILSLWLISTVVLFISLINYSYSYYSYSVGEKSYYWIF